VSRPGPSWSPASGSTHQVALEVLLHGPLARAELARRLDLSPASLTRLTRPLLASGLLVEASPRPDPVTSRPTQPLDIVPRSHLFLGVRLTGDEAQAVLTDLRGTVVATGRAPLPVHAPDPGDVVAAVADLAARVGAGQPPATGLGVTLGGHSADGSTVTVAPFLDWHDVPLGRLIAERTGIATVIANDVAALTVAEHWFGVGKGLTSFAVITVGVGVGYGLVIHDQLVSHPDMGIGLVGHFPLNAGGAVCLEGHRGCATAALTIGMLTAQASVALKRSVGWEELLGLASGGSPVAVRLITDAGHGLGRLIAAVANLTMPDRIVVTGEGVGLAQAAGPAIEEGIRADRDPRAGALDVVISPGNVSRWARGAAVAAIQDFALRAPDRRPAPAGPRRRTSGGPRLVDR
jgi:predicted NBD/HSP70 family sugar kinase